MNRLSLLLSLGLLTGCLPKTTEDSAGLSPSRQPNIIVMMADDMGFSDIGCYGSEIRTPNLDALAGKGVRFSQFYNTGRCCPTRASLLTGLYPHQAGIGHMMEDKGLEGYRGDLNNRCVTLAEALKPAGYRTYMSGKWHVTGKVNAKQETDKHNWPLQRGFDRFYGTIHGAGSFYDPNSLTRDNALISPHADPEYQPKTYYYTDAISDQASRFIREHDSDKPFFLYVAYTAPHWPMHALPEDIARYKGVYDAGWDAIRSARHKKQIEMGLVKSSWPLTPRDNAAPAWDDEPMKEWNIRNMEVYAAMVDRLDQGVGHIVDTLKQTGRFNNTLILFLADNGGCAEGMGRGGAFKERSTDPSLLRPMQATDLQLNMIPKFTRDGYPMRQGKGVMPGPADTYLGYGLSWANASNTPFRLYKHWVHEGGIATPLIAHWPDGIPASRHGMLEHQPAHVIDLMDTSLDAARTIYPDARNGQPLTPSEGTSLLPALSGFPLGRKSPIFWEHEGNRAVRIDNWKLVAKGANGPWELYDMESDRTELKNLADRYLDRTSEMASLWEAWAARSHAKPWPWDPSKK